MLGEYRGLLAHVVLRTNISNKWLWKPDIGGSNSAKSAYQLPTTLASPEMNAMSTFLWHKQVPAKVSVLAWRLVRNRLSTKDNLVARHIIHPDSQFYVTGCGGMETTHHLFMSCPIFAPLRRLIRAWIGIFTADPNTLQDHLVQFTHSTRG
ncbi:70 kDa peptidyl-prolyl isomerase [Trifolium pratense]|uniref:70 kDa peptidyl-prolyl isomerase n=1 Tax=Trifolium pratense TaxID=57577 RepID=A0A2K3JXL3_TRIPR|nr:70 kDa peptidyl-prolyl isomerase [Trifolium pratense]